MEERKNKIDDFLELIREETEQGVEHSYGFILRMMDKYAVLIKDGEPLGNKQQLIEEAFADAYFIATGDPRRLEFNEDGEMETEFIKNSYFLLRDSFVPFCKDVAENFRLALPGYEQTYDDFLVFHQFCYDGICPGENREICLRILEGAKNILTENLSNRKVRIE